MKQPVYKIWFFPFLHTHVAGQHLSPQDSNSQSSNPMAFLAPGSLGPSQTSPSLFASRPSPAVLWSQKGYYTSEASLGAVLIPPAGRDRAGGMAGRHQQ